MNYVLPDLNSDVVVVGGGIAGIWTAYKLINVDIPVTLITYLDKDRGGIQGSTHRSVGAINTSPLTNHDFTAYMDDLGRTCTHPFVTQALQRYLKDEIDELSSLVTLKPIKIGLALESESGKSFLQYMYELFTSRGGHIINAWVTRLIVDKNICQGLQYEQNGYIGKLRCRAIVLASGGYAGLYHNSINTSCFGTILGRFMECGGTATNLEFLFQHGYGNIDTNDLTPTEDIAGAEIYDKSKNRVIWLEKMLFDGKGTNTHLQAVNLWKSSNTDYFVDLSYKQLYLACHDFNLVIHNRYVQQNICNQSIISEKNALEKLLNIFPVNTQFDALQKIIDHDLPQVINYEKFQKLKQLFPVQKNRLFRVKPITYFSMGGIAHISCRTNLKNVYVTGECMHDFGANRVGGLPWALYLVNGQIIKNHIVEQIQADEKQLDFNIIWQKADGNWELLKEIRERLYEYENKNKNENYAVECIQWFQKNREILITNYQRLSDTFAWLIVAEAIVKSCTSRKESRGYFLRSNFPYEDANLDHHFSYVWYDQNANVVKSRFVEASYFTGSWAN